MAFNIKDGKRYYTLNHYYQEIFKEKVFKISLNGGFSCPNKDGTCGYGGCIYCSSSGSGEFAGNKEDDLKTQFERGKKAYESKWKNGKYIAYFQANTNTYAPLHILKEKYEEVLKFKDVIGISISTRPDSITDECLDYLENLSKRTFLIVELGLQTIHEKTSKFINRCHSLECFETMVKRLRDKKINVVVHIINGLPYETKDMMIKTVRYINNLDIQGIKIHMLHILKNTRLEKIYNEKPFKILTKEEYVNIVCDELEILNNNIVVHRLTGDAKEDDLIEPNWIKKKFCVLDSIDNELKRRQTYQGFQNNISNRIHQIIESVLRKKDIVIDATLNNLEDTLFLTNLIPNGTILAFNNNEEVIKETKKQLKFNNHTNYKLFLSPYNEMINELKSYERKVSLILFNLSNENRNNIKAIIKSLQNSLSLLNKKGILLIILQPNNEIGKMNEKSIKNWTKTISNYFIKEYHNTKNPSAPYLITISKINAKWI